MKRTFLWAALLLNGTAPALACTGISFTARDGAFVTARTIEWGESPLPSGYVVIPRQHETVSYTPTGANGLSFRAKYGAVGLTIVREEFIAEGINEAGLSAGLFYFPHYGKYPAYDSTRNDRTLSDLQYVAWILSQFSSVDGSYRSIPPSARPSTGASRTRPASRSCWSSSTASPASTTTKSAC